MHGVHIANDLVKRAREQGNVKKAVIEVGELANITKEDLGKQLCNAADFEFELIEKKAYVRCVCGYEGAPEIVERQHDVVIFSCPMCGLNPEVVEGDRVVLKCIEVE